MPLETLNETNIKSLTIETPKERPLRWDPEKVLTEEYWEKIRRRFSTEGPLHTRAELLAHLQIAAPQQLQKNIKSSSLFIEEFTKRVRDARARFEDTLSSGQLSEFEALIFANVVVAFPELTLVSKGFQNQVARTLVNSVIDSTGVLELAERFGAAILIDPPQRHIVTISEREALIAELKKYWQPDDPVLIRTDAAQFVADARIVLADEWVRPPEQFIKDKLARLAFDALSLDVAFIAYRSRALAIVMADKVLLEGGGKVQLVYDKKVEDKPAGEPLPEPLKF